MTAVLDHLVSIVGVDGGHGTVLNAQVPTQKLQTPNIPLVKHEALEIVVSFP